jgi:hypothetical protein
VVPLKGAGTAVVAGDSNMGRGGAAPRGREKAEGWRATGVPAGEGAAEMAMLGGVVLLIGIKNCRCW